MLPVLASPFRLSPPSTSRRAVSMPTISIPFDEHPPPYSGLPGPGGHSFRSPSSRSNVTSARRLSYALKSRAGRYSVPIGVLAVFILTFLCFIMFSSHSTPQSSFDNASLKWYRRSSLGWGAGGARGGNAGGLNYGNPAGYEVETAVLQGDNGVSLLIADEDELIAEDDLFWESLDEERDKTEEELAEEAELQTRRKEVLDRDRRSSLRSLIWWLAQGNQIPSDWDVPDGASVRKMGGRGFERMLAEIEGTAEDLFDDGWVEMAQARFRVTIFSKTYCPYSKNAKAIIDEYALYPPPYIVELDQRPDTSAIQNLLQHLTGRRTVPNVLLDFVSMGGSDEMTLFHAEGGLRRRLQEIGAYNGRKRKGLKG